MSVYIKLERRTKREQRAYYEGLLEGLEIARKDYLDVITRSIKNVFSDLVNTHIEFSQSTLAELRRETEEK